MKMYTIVGGLDCVGKSSLLGVLKVVTTSLGLIVENDIVLGDELVLNLLSDCINKGINFTLETTLSKTTVHQTIMNACEKNYYIRLYYIGVSTAYESLERINNRVKKGGHNIPTEDVQRRYANRYNDLVKILPYCDEATFWDNENGFVEVAEYQNGIIITKGDYIPLWLMDLSLYLKNQQELLK